MVRNIVGSLIYVGKSKHEPRWIEELLKSRDRKLAAPTFDAAGLYLVGVDYDPVWGLPTAPRAHLPLAMPEALPT
jgi:tRNA pseudouridine38-40 synthase